jgi:ribose transport system ATP-binding protein
VGQQQGVEIARALAFEARVLIMDEPTSALSEQETERLLDLVLDLKRQGVALVYITHKLEELRRIGDDATVLRDGRPVGSFDLAGKTHDEIVRMMVGRDLGGLPPKTPAGPREEALRAEGISLRHPERPGDFAVKDVDFAVRRGEVLGVFGLMGAGRTELLETIFGLHPRASSGRVRVDGAEVTIRSPIDAIARGIALAPEDRKREGLVLEMSVAANASLACLPAMERLGLLDESREAAKVSELARRLGIRTPSLDQRVLHLSGGNQQKVVLAKWLLTGPKVLLLDAPTRGIDVHAKREIYGLVDELARAGLAVVLASSELPEILAVSDRIMVLCEGRKTAEFGRDEADEERILRAALPRKGHGKERIA